MRTATLLMALLALVALAFIGCEGGTTIYDIDGDWNAGTVQFIYGANETWTLYDVLITVDTVEEMIYISGYDSNDLLWGYSGDYDRSQNRVTALDMPEVDFGSEDQMDLHLEFGSSRFEGAAINWVYDGDDLTDVGAANISGRYVGRMSTRQVTPQGDAEKKPRLRAAD